MKRIGVHGTVFVPSSQLAPAWVCQECGGYVGDLVRHDKWHFRLAPLLSTVTPKDSR